MTDPQTPINELAPPAAPDNPAAQLDEIARIVAVVNEIGHPRIKPVKQKLNRAFARVGKSAEAGVGAERIAVELAADLRELRQQTYQLLMTVVNQIRGTMRAKRFELSPAEREQAEKLQHGLGLFAQAMRKMLEASKKDDAASRDAAVKLMAEAHLALEERP